MPLPNSDQRRAVPARDSLGWLGYLFTPALDASTDISRRLALAQGAFALIRPRSRPGAGLALYVCHRLATSMVAPILLYGADPFSPSEGAMARLNSFWHNVQRWTTTRFSATTTGILAVESCLPLVALLISQRQRLAALQIVCSPPEINPATARLEASFPSLSAHRAHYSSRALTKGLSFVYVPLYWKTQRPVPPMRNHLPIDAVAYRTIPFTHGLSRILMISSHLVSPVPTVPARSLMDNTYSALKTRVSEASLRSGQASSRHQGTTTTSLP